MFIAEEAVAPEANPISMDGFESLSLKPYPRRSLVEQLESFRLKENEPDIKGTTTASKIENGYHMGTSVIGEEALHAIYYWCNKDEAQGYTNTKISISEQHAQMRKDGNLQILERQTRKLSIK
jgi:hypothetical protein